MDPSGVSTRDFDANDPYTAGFAYYLANAPEHMLNKGLGSRRDSFNFRYMFNKNVIDWYTNSVYYRMEHNVPHIYPNQDIII